MSERTGNELRAEVPLRSRRRWLGGGLVAVALMLIGLLWLLRAPEPEFQGRRLVDMLGDLVRPADSGSYLQASNAVVALGPEALPVIVRGIEHSPPWHIGLYLQRQNKLPAGVRATMSRWLDPYRYVNRRAGSIRALQLIGTNAAPAAADLVRAFHVIDLASAVQLAPALVHVGSAVIPPLKPHLVDPDLRKRSLAAFVLHQLGSASAEAAPELIAGLAGADENHRRLVAQTLGRMGSSVLPQVTPLLASTNAEMRLLAVQALNQLLPRARELTPELMGLLDDLSPEIRLEVANLLVSWWSLPMEDWRWHLRSLPADHPSRVRYGRLLDGLEAGEARLLAVLREGLVVTNARARLQAATRLVQINRVNADVIVVLQNLHTNLNGAPWEMAALTNVLNRARQLLTNAIPNGPALETSPHPNRAPTAQFPSSTVPPRFDKAP